MGRSPLLESFVASARCIRAWPLLQREDTSRVSSCVRRSGGPTTPDCSAPVSREPEVCRTPVPVAITDGLVPNPAACERRCRRRRG
ncbi:hypothetical protein BSP109_02996 [Brevibacterium sp. Mu109]|nr:hypothetical protein BSP109_02996 [Brevibacterium sp. Mu109]